jgi:regulator of protease activity HflC (stomatin/prohibitin superfamily)
MKKLLAFFAIALLFVATFSTSSCTRIDAGYEGIKVKQYGSDKGVQDTALVTGRVWYNPVNYDVVQYPVFFRTADYDAFSVNAKDGSIFDIDPMINYRVMPGYSPRIFVKYRQDIDELQKTVILTFVKNAFKNIFNTYTTDSVLSKREEFDLKVTNLLTAKLRAEGFEVGEMTFGMRYPESINKAIEAKNKATQEAQQKENELRTTRANAEIIITQAQAEAKANLLKQQTLTPLLVAQQFIEKWDGKSSLYGFAPNFMKSVETK